MCLKWYLAFCLDPVLNACTTKQAWASQAEAYHHSHLNYNVEFRSQIGVTKKHPEKLTKNAERISVLNADSAKFILGKISASSSIPSLKIHYLTSNWTLIQNCLKEE